jgi:hypothetical protein
LSKCPWYFELVYDDAVVVNFAEAVSLFQVGPANLVVVWHVITLTVARDAQINIRDLGIAVHKNDVVVKKVYVQNQQKELNEESHEESDEAAVVRSLVIIVYLKEVTIHLLVAHVHNHNKEEVETGAKPVPGNQFAELYREAKDPPVCNVIYTHQKHE